MSGYLRYFLPPLLDHQIADAQKINKQWLILQEQISTASKPTSEA